MAGAFFRGGRDGRAAWRAARSDALAVFARAGVDFDLVALVHEQGHRHFEAGGDLGGLEHLAGRVALDGGLGPGDFALDAGGQFDRDGLAVVEHHFDGHAVFQVVQRVAHVLGFDFVLVVFGVHAHVHRVGEVGVGALLLVQDHVVDLVVGLEHHFGAHVVQQGLELHAHGGGAAAAACVFGLEDDHRVLAVHDHVAGADFLSDFHSRSAWVGAAQRTGAPSEGRAASAAVRQGRRAGSAAGGCAGRHAELRVPPLLGAKPRILAFFLDEPEQLRHEVVLREQAAARRLHAVAPLGEVGGREGGQGGRVPDAVPGVVEMPQRGRCLQPVEEGVELGMVRAVVLRIDVPDEGLPGPERAHQRILAAHGVQVAGPQHFVESGLGAVRQPGDGRPAGRRGLRGRAARQRGAHGGGGAPLGGQQVGARLFGEAAQQGGQPGGLVAEQRDGQRVRGHAVAGPPGGAVEGCLARGQVRLAQQPARARREARVEEPAGASGGGAGEKRRRQAVAALDVGLGREVFQVDPHGAPGGLRPVGGGQAGEEGLGDVAAEGLDEHVARPGGHRFGGHRTGGGPGQHLHARCALGRHPGEGGGVVGPQPHAVARRTELGREAPADADVAEVVDDAAEEVPGKGGGGGHCATSAGGAARRWSTSRRAALESASPARTHRDNWRRAQGSASATVRSGRVPR